MGAGNGYNLGRRAHVRRGVIAAVVSGLMLVAAFRPLPVFATTDAPAASSSLGFPIGWYSGLWMPHKLPEIAADGMGTVLPYHRSTHSVTAYLETARSQGLQVWVEIPRELVKSVDLAGVSSFVSTHAAHPALMGWYLADEPTINHELGPLSPENATKLYNEIKRTDDAHPVAIAFYPGEKIASYHSAMDVVMVDNYPCKTLSLEFGGFDNWRASMLQASAIAERESDFFPIIQAYGGAYERRHPTLAEERYMVYTSLQMGATGMFFWIHYHSDREWVRQVIRPLVNDLNRMRPALTEGEAPGMVTSPRSDVTATAFRDAETQTTYVVAVHHGRGTVDAPLTLANSVTSTKADRLGPQPTTVSITNHKLGQKLGSYGVNVYELL